MFSIIMGSSRKIKHSLYDSDDERTTQAIDSVENASTDQPPQDNKTEDTCSICLGASSWKAIKELPCSHRFHKVCLNRWLNYNRTCPLCRKLSIPFFNEFYSTDNSGEKMRLSRTFNLEDGRLANATEYITRTETSETVIRKLYTGDCELVGETRIVNGEVIYADGITQ